MQLYTQATFFSMEINETEMIYSHMKKSPKLNENKTMKNHMKKKLIICSFFPFMSHI